MPVSDVCEIPNYFHNDPLQLQVGEDMGYTGLDGYTSLVWVTAHWVRRRRDGVWLMYGWCRVGVGLLKGSRWGCCTDDVGWCRVGVKSRVTVSGSGGYLDNILPADVT